MESHPELTNSCKFGIFKGFSVFVTDQLGEKKERSKEERGKTEGREKGGRRRIEEGEKKEKEKEALREH